MQLFLQKSKVVGDQFVNVMILIVGRTSDGYKRCDSCGCGRICIAKMSEYAA